MLGSRLAHSMPKKKSQLSLFKADVEGDERTRERRRGRYPEYVEKLIDADRRKRSSQRRTFAKKRAQGLFLAGAPPFGYRVGEGLKLIADERETQIVSFIVALRRERVTYRAIAKRCKEQGFKNRKGHPITVCLVTAICLREAPEIKIPRGRRPKSGSTDTPKEAA
jgi:hypothetical protein